MAHTALQDVDVALLYIESIPTDYFDDFRQIADDDGLELIEEPRENVPYAAVEWVVPTIVAVYIGKKFVDAFLKRASDDFADAVYPKFKTALITLAKKLLVRDRDEFSVISSSPNKVTNPHSLIFSVYSETKINRRVKFVFHEELSDIEYDECIEKIFVTLREHHIADGDEDTLSRGNVDVTERRAGEIYLLYETETSQWEIFDPIKEAVKRQSSSDDNAT